MKWKNKLLGNRRGEVSSLMGLLTFWYSDSRAGIKVGTNDEYRLQLLLVYSQAKVSRFLAGGIVTATNSFLHIFSRYSLFFLVLVKAV